MSDKTYVARSHFAVRNPEGKIVGRAVQMRPGAKNPTNDKFVFTFVDGKTGTIQFRVYGEQEMRFRFEAKGWELIDSHLVAGKPTEIAPGVFRIRVQSNCTEEWSRNIDIQIDPSDDRSLRSLLSEKLVNLSQMTNCETHISNWMEV